MPFFKLSDLPESPWKNGGGSTRELVRWPEDSSLEDFEWRVSVATLTQSGQFSAFPGVDRQIMLLSGAGVALTSTDPAQPGQHLLNERWQPYAFPGEQPIRSTLLGGESSDFNVMTRRARWQASLQVCAGPLLPQTHEAGLIFVLAGQWRGQEGVLEPGDGFWWSAVPETFTLQPQSSESRLARVTLTRTGGGTQEFRLVSDA